MSGIVVQKYDEGNIWIVIIDLAHKRNAINVETADELFNTFMLYDKDPSSKVAILTGNGGVFCAGADLKAVGSESRDKTKRWFKALGEGQNPKGPLGPTRLQLTKPVIAAVDGYAVAGGLELALWADMRVCSENAVFGVFCRRFGVPLIDGGTVRLPRLIGLSRAQDMILTGRPVKAQEALSFGLVNRIAPKGTTALDCALQLARDIAAFPQNCMRGDFFSARRSFGDENARLRDEFSRAMKDDVQNEARSGGKRFTSGTGRHGDFSKSNL